MTFGAPSLLGMERLIIRPRQNSVKRAAMGRQDLGNPKEAPTSLGDVGRLIVKGGVYQEIQRTSKLAR